MSFDNFGFDAASGEPQAYGGIVGGTCNNMSIGGEGDGCSFFSVTVKCEISLGVGDIPKGEIVVVSRGYYIFSEWVKSYRSWLKAIELISRLVIMLC